MLSSPVRMGLVGYGFGGRYFHAPLLAAASEVEFVGVSLRHDAQAAQLAVEHPGVPAFRSLADLASVGVEAVAISTPLHSRAELLDEAAGLGLAVVFDKPFAWNADEARSYVATAAAAGILLSVYQNRRWDSDFLTVERLLAEGVLGEVFQFESRFERYAPLPGPPPAAGGTMRDFGAHQVDQARRLFGPVRAVDAVTNPRPDCDGRDDDFYLALHHVSGVRSLLWGSWRQAASGPRFRVSGSKGAYVVGAGGTGVVRGIDIQEELLLAGRSPATDGDAWGAEPEDRWGTVWTAEGAHVEPTERGRWDSFYPAFARAVRGEGPVPVDPLEVVANVEIIDAGLRSADSGERELVSRAVPGPG